MRFPRLPFLLISALAWTNSASAAPSPSDDEATIRRQSQEFSDASASGDAKVLAKYLDDDVVFMEESGKLDTKQEIVAGAQPPADGISNRLVQSDLVIKLHGDVAVTSFTDNATFSVYGQTTRVRFRSTEVWRKQDGAWKMISSQTLAQPDDPPAVLLPGAKLDEYVGTYRAGPQLVVKIARAGEALESATNGGDAHPLLAEAPDVMFTPGQPRVRRIFERNAAGAVVGFNARHEGHDLHFRREA